MEKQLTIKSEIKNIQEVEKLIDNISEELKLNKTLYGNVLISVFEAVNNAIMHGNKQDQERDVNIRITHDDKERKLMIYVKDQGKGFNYYNIPDPTSEQNLESVNGRGIFLMKQLSDGIIFHEDGSMVEIIFKL
jgi:serine/threonine-protein kinase RsbW